MSKKLICRIIMLVLVCFLLSACSEDTKVSLSEDTSAFLLEQGESTVFQKEQSEEIVVYVNGAVKNPGVYTLKQGDRIYQAIDMAGGMTSRAVKDAINLAETVVDAQNIYVMTRQVYQKSQKEKECIATGQENDDTTDFVNINTADKVKLETLPGIGASKAAAIIAYREENGQFSSKEDIKNVSGIGDATYTNIKDLITIE